MGWRFRRSFRIAPGIRLNAGKRGFTSVSLGGRGATLNLGSRGVTSTVSLPGTGLSYQHRFSNRAAAQQTQTAPSASPTTGRGSIKGICVLVVLLVGGYLALHSQASISNSERIDPTVAASIASDVVLAANAATVNPRMVIPETVTIHDQNDSSRTRQVTTIQANVRSAPSLTGVVVQTLTQGQTLLALQTQNGWTQVAERDGQPIGWMHNSVLK